MLEVRNAYLGFAAVFHTCVLQEARLRPTTFAHHSTFSAFPQKSTPLLTPLEEYSALLEARGKMLEVRNVYLGFAAVFHTCVLQEARSKTAPHNLCSSFHILRFFQKSAPLLTPLEEYSASGLFFWVVCGRGDYINMFYKIFSHCTAFHNGTRKVRYALQQGEAHLLEARYLEARGKTSVWKKFAQSYKKHFLASCLW